MKTIPTDYGDISVREANRIFRAFGWAWNNLVLALEFPDSEGIDADAILKQTLDEMGNVHRHEILRSPRKNLDSVYKFDIGLEKYDD